mmetsp:Transcript_73166/g.161483  ORF Transcript_73166/g.161483 Transcript_73166/m.161483 type:complete len:219 (+) Transcript_73166:903-1559(+)
MSSRRIVGKQRGPIQRTGLQTSGGVSCFRWKPSMLQLRLKSRGIPFLEIGQVISNERCLLIRFQTPTQIRRPGGTVTPPTVDGFARGQRAPGLPFEERVIDVPVHVEGAVPTTHRLSVVIAAQLADLLVSFQGMAAPCLAVVAVCGDLMTFANTKVVLATIPLVHRPNFAEAVAMHGDALIVLRFQMRMPNPGWNSAPNSIHHTFCPLVEGVTIWAPL